jgi:hypothetical protein
LVRSGIADEAKKAGDQAPDFELPDISGEMVKLTSLLAEGPVVLTWIIREKFLKEERTSAKMLLSPNKQLRSEDVL